jgi:hypothetical protein
MSKYEVSANDTIFGVYDAESESEARDLCARDAGYESEADMAQRLGEKSALVAVEVEEWLTWEDGKRDDAVAFFHPIYGGPNLVESAANHLCVDVSESLNVRRV